MKKRAKAGFTLVEMLCSVILVILVSIGLANGVQLAVENYTRSIIHSESQVLCETLTTAASDKLRNCKEISPGKTHSVFQRGRWKEFQLCDGRGGACAAGQSGAA